MSLFSNTFIGEVTSSIKCFLKIEWNALHFLLYVDFY